MTLMFLWSLAQTPAPPLPPDALTGVERRVEVVVSATGLRQNVLVTRPAGTAGTLPAVLAVPWLSCGSMAIPEKQPHGVQQLLRHLAERSNVVLMRIEKPGVGGSEGVCRDTDFEAELAGNQAAFEALRRHPWVDASRVVVLGQSYAGGILPLVAPPTSVSGYVVINGWVRTWFERLIDFERAAMEGEAPDVVAGRMRKLSLLYSRFLNEGLTPGEVIDRVPDLATVWDGDRTRQYGRAAAFYHQLQGLNLESAWSRVAVPTLAFWGEYDIVMQREDHERLTTLVNTNLPGAAQLIVVPRMDHSMSVHESRQRARTEPAAGVYAASVAADIDRWLRALWQR